MPQPGRLLSKILTLIDKRFLWFLLGTYAIAAFAPSFGMRLKDISFGRVGILGQSTKVTLSMAMLGLLLFDAGLGVSLAKLKDLARRPWLLVLGVAANLTVPLAFILIVNAVMAFWHNTDEVQNILVGLALVAAMPIAGSSTAWTQNANGDLPLSLGLVVASTLFSPLTTPLALHAVGLMAKGDYAEDLHDLANHGTGAFLAVAVILPSVLGIGVNRLVGDARLTTIEPYLVLVNSAVLLLLSYTNASVALPQAIRRPDPDFLVAILAITLGLCVVAFGSGYAIARAFQADDAKRTSLMFGLGMNNNGTGLVLASMALAEHPQVMLPVIFYNLVQQIVAGGVDYVRDRAVAAKAHGAA